MKSPPQERGGFMVHSPRGPAFRKRNGRPEAAKVPDGTSELMTQAAAGMTRRAMPTSMGTSRIRATRPSPMMVAPATPGTRL